MVGLVLAIVTITALSGCTSYKKNSSTSINDDFYVDGTPLIEQTTQDSNGNYVGGTGLLGEWGVSFIVRSKSGKAYSNVAANVTAYDKNNQVISTKIYNIPYLPRGLGESIRFGSKTEVDHVTMNVVNATPSN